MRREPPSPARVYSRDELRELDRAAEREYEIPSILLMENAARHAADVALDGLGPAPGAGVLIVAGPGKNGGDALAVARHLHNASLRVRILSLGAGREGDARVNLRIARAMGLSITPVPARGAARAVLAAARALRPCALVVDGLFGTGLSRAPAGAAAETIRAINRMGEAGTPVLALDVPSGMDPETGAAPGVCVRASVTVTFAGLKQGFLSLAAQSLLGEVIIADIGAPRELSQRLGRPLSAPPRREPRTTAREESMVRVGPRRVPGRRPTTP